VKEYFQNLLRFDFDELIPPP